MQTIYSLPQSIHDMVLNLGRRIVVIATVSMLERERDVRKLIKISYFVQPNCCLMNGNNF